MRWSNVGIALKLVERLDEGAIRKELFIAMKHYIVRNRLRAIDVFSKWDDNDRSFISHEEFVRSLQQFLPMQVHKFKMDLLLSWLDPKDTGNINYRDFLQMVRDYKPPVPKSGKKKAKK